MDIVRRAQPPEPWAEGEKIPWNEPEFSRRMLREHLSQEHDAASRRYTTIDRQVAWIHNRLLDGRPARVLDLACGPGLYANRLARLGHDCRGIDFSPASVAYAREQSAGTGLPCTFAEQDIRQAEYGMGYDLALLIFGEFNTFRPADARLILRKAHAALAAAGQLLLEPHTFDFLHPAGQAPAHWYATPGGLFSAEPHLCLTDYHWDAARQVATTRYYIIDAGTGRVTRHAESLQAYTDQQYRDLIAECGFASATFYPGLTGAEDDAHEGLCAIVARKGSGAAPN